MGRNEEAIESYKQAVQIKAGLAEAHLNLGMTYLRVGDRGRLLTFLYPSVKYGEILCLLGWWGISKKGRVVWDAPLGEPDVGVKDMDCLIIHTPKFNNYYKPFKEFMWVNYMPLGLLGIADYLNRNGITCRVLHLGVESIHRRSWELEESLKPVAPSVFAVSLHWHYQAYDVIETCKKIREIHPKAYIVLGGFTASFFHEEIIRDFQWVDGVIRGDGEVPLLELVKKVKAGDRDFRDVPNLTWRTTEGDVVDDGVTYCADEAMLNELRFANMDLLENYRTYIDYITLPFIVVKGIPIEVNFKMFTTRYKLFPLCVGRGCPHNCTWCSGSYTFQKERITSREKVIWRGYDAVIADVKQALRFGYEGMYTVFDPTPDNQSYFVGLFQKIRKEGLKKKLGWMHEATGVTSKEFVDEFSETFREDFRIIGLSPETGNEGVRKQNKGYYYSNKEFHEMLDYIVSKNVNVEIFFTYGIPGENEEKLKESYKMRNEIVKRHGRRNCLRALSIEMEPGAPWFIAPERFGVVTSRRTFADFVKAHSKATEGTYTSLGYYIPGYFKEPLDPKDPEGAFGRRLQKLKCKHFCFIHPDGRKTASPFWGRMLCRVTPLILKLRGRANGKRTEDSLYCP